MGIFVKSFENRILFLKTFLFSTNVNLYQDFDLMTMSLYWTCNCYQILFYLSLQIERYDSFQYFVCVYRIRWFMCTCLCSHWLDILVLMLCWTWWKSMVHLLQSLVCDNVTPLTSLFWIKFLQYCASVKLKCLFMKWRWFRRVYAFTNVIDMAYIASLLADIICIVFYVFRCSILILTACGRKISLNCPEI